MGQNFQEILLREVREFFRPILDTQGDPRLIFAFLETMGWYVRPALSPAQEADMVAAFDAISDFAGTGSRQINTLKDVRDALEDVIDVIDGIEAFRDCFDILPGLDPGQLIGDVLNALSLLYIRRKSPFMLAALRLLTLVESEPNEHLMEGDASRFRDQLPRLRFDRIGAVLSDPETAFANAYWPNPITTSAEAIAVANRLFPRVMELLHFVSQTAPIRAAAGNTVLVPTPNQAQEDRLSAMLSVWWDYPDVASALDLQVGVTVGVLPAAGNSSAGVSVVPFGALGFSRSLGRWLVDIRGDYSAEGFQITRSGVSLSPGGGKVPHVALVLAPDSGTDSDLLIGSTTGSRLEVKNYWIEADAAFTPAEPEISLFLRMRQGALVIDAGDGDGFLQKILPPDGLRIDFDLGIGWSNLRGFHIEGSGSFEFRVPLHLSIGPVAIQGITIRAGFLNGGADSNGELPISIGCDVKAELGPIVAVVENMGVRFDLGFPKGGGNLGPMEWKPGFKAPNGIGLAIEGGGFSGGGFISLEPELHRYAGLLELEFQSGFALKAIGLLDTILPGGEEGFSLLIIISAEFSPIQLSFGFTLNGVGGMLGVNRTTDIDVLRAGVKSGAMTSILFPHDIIANAAQIVSDLRAIFPPAAGRYLFGPMAKIGWGTPTLVEIELGLMIEGLSPWRIMLPGVVRLALPSRDNAILKLQVNFLGTWEQDKKTITFYASIFDSSLLSMALTGDMAFLMKYGDSPNFVVTAGGWHPCFTPPPLPFPPLSRMGLVIRNDNDLQIILSSYFAVTSNTAQFGSGVQLLARHGKYSVEGHLGFDALFHFSPFSMTVDLAATLTLRKDGKVKFGVEVYANLSGPTPWSARGSATFTILKVDITFEFAKRWGEERNTALEAVDVFTPFRKAIEHLGNWEAVIPADSSNQVTLKGRDPAEAGLLLLRPDGGLTVKQKVVPLGIDIDLFGNQPPSSDRRFAIKRFLVGGIELPHVPVKDEFAPAQFKSLSDAEKLSRNSFEQMSAGGRLSGANFKLRTSAGMARELKYELKIIDSRLLWYTMSATAVDNAQSFLMQLPGNSTSQFSGSHYNAMRTLVPGGAVTVAGEGYSVVSADTLRMFSTNATFGSQAEAHDFLDGLVANDASLAGAYQIVPNVQARAA